MSGSYTLLILFACGAIVFSFLCSLWESVLLSISPSFAHELEERREPVGLRLKKFKANIDVPLAAILTLNTIAHTVGAIGVGEQATRLWSDSNPLITGMLVPVVMTLGIKTLGANNWQRLTPFTVFCLDLLIKLLYPIIWCTQLLTRGLRHGNGEPVLTRSQFLTLADVGEREGILDETESEIIRSLLRFREVEVRAVMTPRTVSMLAAESMTTRAFVERHPQARFSRIPVHEPEHPDNVTGYVLKDDVLQLAARDENVALGSIKRDILIVADRLKIPRLFEQFIENREHIAVVVDEFGAVLGVVTMEDVIETMLGLEIIDESDGVEDMQQLARKNWQQRAAKLGILTDVPSSDRIVNERDGV